MWFDLITSFVLISSPSFRYVLISCHANYGRIYSQTNIFLMIAFAWTFSFGILVPPLAEVWGTFGLKEKTFSCTILR